MSCHSGFRGNTGLDPSKVAHMAGRAAVSPSPSAKWQVPKQKSTPPNKLWLHPLPIPGAQSTKCPSRSPAPMRLVLPRHALRPPARGRSAPPPLDYTKDLTRNQLTPSPSELKHPSSKLCILSMLILMTTSEAESWRSCQSRMRRGLCFTGSLRRSIYVMTSASDVVISPQRVALNRKYFLRL